MKKDIQRLLNLIALNCFVKLTEQELIELKYLRGKYKIDENCSNNNNV